MGVFAEAAGRMNEAILRSAGEIVTFTHSGGSAIVTAVVTTPDDVDGQDILVIAKGLETSPSSRRGLLLSTDNGENFFSQTGDYQTVKQDGVISASAVMEFIPPTAVSGARTFASYIPAAGVAGIPKLAVGDALQVDAVLKMFVGSYDAVNAVRIQTDNGAKFTAGEIFVLIR